MSDYVVNINTAIQISRLTKPKRDTHRRKLLPIVDLCDYVVQTKPCIL